MSVSHLKVTQAGLVSLATTIVGQVVAFVPAFAPDKQILISAASAGIGFAFLVANAVHHLADSNVSARAVEAGAIQAAREEISHVDFNALAQQAVQAQASGQLAELAKGEAQAALQRVLGQLGAPPAAPSGPVPAAAAPPPAA